MRLNYLTGGRSSLTPEKIWVSGVSSSSRSEPQLPIPFHTTPDSASSPQRRLLIITYAFPPIPVAGALRWQKLTRYAVERGWGVDVVCLDPSSSELLDTDRLRDLPADMRVYGVWDKPLLVEHVANRLFRLYRMLRKAGTGVRASSMSREESVRAPMLGGSRALVRMWHAYVNFGRFGRWARQAALLALKIMGPQHKAIITSGPPHMTHEAGCIVAQQTGLPFVMDMRDPWSLVERLGEEFATPFYFRLAAKYERRAIQAASLVVANTDAAAQALRRIYPTEQERIITVMNGYDEEPLPLAERRLRFIIAYAGSIYLGQDPGPLFQGAARVIRELALTPNDFSIQFMGTVHGTRPIPDIAADEGIEAFVYCYAPRPRHDALQFLANASMLVSLPLGDAIPSKLFEYIRFNSWVLAFTQPESATALLLGDSGADIVGPYDIDGIAEVIRRRYLEHARGIRPAAIAQNGRFSRRAQAEILLDRLDSLTAGPQPKGGALS